MTELPGGLRDLQGELRAELDALADPLLRRLSDIDEWIATHRQALDDLRAARLELVHVLRPIVGEERIPMEPGRKSKPGPKAAKAKQTGIRHADRTGTGISEPRLAELLAWLRETYNGSTFYGSAIVRDYPDVAKRFGGQASVARALRVLHNREQIAIDGVGERRSILYKVVS